MSVWASTNYAPLIEDIEQRLDKTAELYSQQQTDEARRTVQMAYFEVFENLAQSGRLLAAAGGDLETVCIQQQPLHQSDIVTV